jgi:hypothetical protein
MSGSLLIAAILTIIALKDSQRKAQLEQKIIAASA